MWKRGCVGHKIAWILVIIGGLNWGLIGALDVNLVNWLLGTLPIVERVVYVVVGLAAIFAIFPGKCTACKVESDKVEKQEKKQRPAGGGQGGGMQ